MQSLLTPWVSKSLLDGMLLWKRVINCSESIIEILSECEVRFYLTRCIPRKNIMVGKKTLVGRSRPGKSAYFLASWAKFSSSRADFPSVWDGFPCVFLYFFPSQSKNFLAKSFLFCLFFSRPGKEGRKGKKKKKKDWVGSSVGCIPCINGMSQEWQHVVFFNSLRL